MQMKFLTGLIPELPTGWAFCHLGDNRRGDAVEDNDTIGEEDGKNLCHDVLQTATVTTDEDGIRTGELGDVRFEEVADMDVNAWHTKSTGIFVNNSLTFRTDFETTDLKMGELQAGLDGYAACAETDIPKDVSLGQFEGLERQQTDGHLGDHFLTTIEQHEGGVGNAEFFS